MRFRNYILAALITIAAVLVIVISCIVWKYSYGRKVSQVVEMEGNWQPVARELLESEKGKKLLFEKLDKKHPARQVYPLKMRVKSRHIRCKKNELIEIRITLSNSSDNKVDTFRVGLSSMWKNDEEYIILTNNRCRCQVRFHGPHPDNLKEPVCPLKSPRILWSVPKHGQENICIAWGGNSYNFWSMGSDYGKTNFRPGIYFAQIRYNPFRNKDGENAFLISETIVVEIE